MSLQMFYNKMKSPAVLPVRLAEHLQILKEMCFIYNDKCISDTKTYDEGSFGHCKIDFFKEHLNEQSKKWQEQSVILSPA